MFRSGAGTAPSAPGRSVSPATSLLFVSFESGFLALCLSWYEIRARLWKSQQSQRRALECVEREHVNVKVQERAIYRQMALDRFQLSHPPQLKQPRHCSFQSRTLPVHPHFSCKHLRCTHIHAPIRYEHVCPRLSFD